MALTNTRLALLPTERGSGTIGGQRRQSTLRIHEPAPLSGGVNTVGTRKNLGRSRLSGLLDAVSVLPRYLTSQGSAPCNVVCGVSFVPDYSANTKAKW